MNVNFHFIIFIKSMSDFWDQFSRTYTSLMENSMLVFGLSLSNKLHIHEAQNILETACGGGLLTIHNL